MNIGIDIDDTITETSEFLMPYVAKYFSLDINYLKNNNIVYFDLPQKYKNKEVAFGKATFDKVLLDVPVKKGAKEIISKLKSEGNKIIIITARDYSLYDDPFDFTSKQLAKLGIQYDKLVCSFDKRKVCIDEKIDLFIDDVIDNLKQAESVVNKVLLFNSIVNLTQESYFTRVNSWQEIYEYIIKINNS